MLQAKHGPTISVSSEVQLPPEVLIPSNRLNLLDTIGQGKCTVAQKKKRLLETDQEIYFRVSEFI